MGYTHPTIWRSNLIMPEIQYHNLPFDWGIRYEVSSLNNELVVRVKESRMGFIYKYDYYIYHSYAFAFERSNPKIRPYGVVYYIFNHKEKIIKFINKLIDGIVEGDKENHPNEFRCITEEELLLL